MFGGTSPNDAAASTPKLNKATAAGGQVVDTREGTLAITDGAPMGVTSSSSGGGGVVDAAGTFGGEGAPLALSPSPPDDGQAAGAAAGSGVVGEGGGRGGGGDGDGDAGALAAGKGRKRTAEDGKRDRGENEDGAGGCEDEGRGRDENGENCESVECLIMMNDFVSVLVGTGMRFYGNAKTRCKRWREDMIL